MSGSRPTGFCSSCGLTFDLRGKAMTIAATCPKCRTYFRVNGGPSDKTHFLDSYAPAIPVGSKGVIDDVRYQVMGFAVKRELKYKYKWREYLLFNPYEGYAFLSEYDGHWNFVWPLDENPMTGLFRNAFVHEGEEFRLFQRYESEVVFASGEFFFDIVEITGSTLNREFIAPPYLIGEEVSDDSLIYYKGNYISHKEVAAAFNVPVKRLPPRKGTGYTQPIFESIQETPLLIVTAVTIALALLIHLLVMVTADQTIVFKGNFSESDLSDQKVLVSPSFTLDRFSQSLLFDLYAPVSNDWVVTDIALINEDTGVEYNFSKEIAYYAGNEDGESWSEGSRYGEAYLSRVPGGKYHINVYPEWGQGNVPFSISLKHDVPVWSNFFWLVFAILLFPAGFFLIRHQLEISRWKESDFSPYAD